MLLTESSPATDAQVARGNPDADVFTSRPQMVGHPEADAGCERQVTGQDDSLIARRFNRTLVQ